MTLLVLAACVISGRVISIPFIGTLRCFWPEL